ncbi:hypothetical protein FSP39_021201 [Pinctada imbricata]|uniref:DNA mismatch repair proteins mutS family domain-containing protein n=1 Tax=Pinctada imbricata TaxID=66713 RepID=A0AA89BL55_PINIB|nr:hypothetical protein FSP39_021201 [Pinctada imbricata]
MARGEIGLASIDLKNPTLILSQFSDTQIYVKTITKLLLLKPVEIIMPNTACENGNMTKLMKLVTDEFQGISVSTVQRKYFNETSGIEYVKQLCVPEFNSVEMEVATKYYCLAAAAALMKYVQFMQNAIYAPGSLRIIFTGSENTTLIDAASAKKLELLQNLRDPRSDHTLYGIINYTKTSGGARLLRANILQPPCDIETITMRQDVVAELTEKEDVFYNMQAILGRFLDIDHLLSQCIQIPKQETMKTAENKLTNIIYLKHTIEMIGAFRNALGDCENSLFKAYYKSLEDPRFTLIQSKICSVIDEQAKYQKGGLNMRTQSVVTELLSDIRDNIGCLYKLSETVAVVDMLQSFAHACTLSNYVRPEFTDTLAIKQGRHPILEKISVEAPVPNDVYASEDSNFIIITGPNMSGKSTYIRQIVLLQVLAQIGCFVPAVYASFRITDHIFTRIGSDDDMQTNSSTFMLEMREINYITQNASSRSLIITDELGRGTSAEEGVGICHAICEHLLKQKSFTFFTTHFLELTNLESLYPNVENFCFEVYHTYTSDGDQKKIVYTHVLTKGKTQEKHYGLQLAELSTMPSSVVENAKKIANQIIQEKQQREEMQVELKQQRADFKLATRLIQAARNSRLDEDGLRIYLSSLKQQYFQEIGKISNPSNLSLPDE